MVKLTEMELKKLIKGGETNTIELKVAAPRAVEMAERLCGIANAQGGLVIIGVKDASHEIVGVPDHRLGETLDVILRAVRHMINLHGIGKETGCCYSQAESWAGLSGPRSVLGEARYPYRLAKFVGIARNGQRPGFGELGTPACS